MIRRLVLIAAALAVLSGLALPSAHGVAAILSTSPNGIVGPRNSQRVAIAGTGFGDGIRYTVSVEGHILGLLVSGGSGTVAGSVLVPPLPCGTHQIALTPVQGISPAATVPYRVVCPSIALKPPSAFALQLPLRTSVVPTDFDFRADNKIRLLYVDGHPVGTFAVTQPIDFAAPSSCGRHDVRLVQRSPVAAVTTGVLSARALFVVHCPHIAARPAIFARSDGPLAIAVGGGDFDEFAAAWLLMDGRQIAPVMTDGAGRVTGQLDGRHLGCGAHAISVQEVGRPWAQASTSVLVTCATLEVTPTLLTAGMTAHVVGHGFHSGAWVQVRWVRADGASAVPVPAVRADSHGDFALDCPVLDRQGDGQDSVIASDGLARASATAQISGTGQPGLGDSSLLRR